MSASLKRGAINNITVRDVKHIGMKLGQSFTRCGKLLVSLTIHQEEVTCPGV